MLCCRLVTLAISTQNISVVLACAVMALHFSVRSLTLYIVSCLRLSCGCAGCVQSRGPAHHHPRLRRRDHPLHPLLPGLHGRQVTCHVSRVPPRVTACRRISVEKDWIVAVCGGSCARLSVTNTNVRTIDLAANLTAPLLAGQLLYFCPYYIAALVLIIWVTEQLSIDFECFVLHTAIASSAQTTP